MIRVVFDLSVRGFAEISPEGRTGIYRIMENLTENLLTQPNVDLSFSATESFLFFEKVKESLLKEPLSRCRLLSEKSLLNKSYEKLYLKNKSLSNQKISFTEKVIRRLCFEGMRFCESQFSTLSKSDLKEIDIFHSPYWGLPKLSSGGGKIKRFLTVCDLISVFHPEFSADQGRFLKSIMMSVDKKDWVVCISEATRQDFLKFRKDFPPEHALVIPCAVSESLKPCTDTEEINRICKRYGMRSGHYFLGLSTYDSRKNMEGLITSFNQLVAAEKLTDVELVLVGAETSKIKNSGKLIRALGFVPDEDLSAIYSGALAFVYPSFYEGFGIPVLEAMKCATPVITSNTSSLPEVVDNAAKMIDPFCPDTLTEAMYELYKNSELRNKLSVMGLHRASQFSWEKTTQSYVKAYQLALSD